MHPFYLIHSQVTLTYASLTAVFALRRDSNPRHPVTGRSILAELLSSMEDGVGIEPTTKNLTGSGSTAELPIQ